MEHEGSLRSITASVAFVKLRKLVDCNVPIPEICRRLNCHDEASIHELTRALDDREQFNRIVGDINRQLKEKRSDRNAESIRNILIGTEISAPVIQYNDRREIPWLSLPKYLVPDFMSLGTYLAGKRKDWIGLARRIQHCKRKRIQIETLINILQRFTNIQSGEPIRILDLCGGRGDLALMIAFLFPNTFVTVMDRNKLGLLQVMYRAGCLGLSNVRVEEVDLFCLKLRPKRRWDIVLGLHACGSLADVIVSELRDRCEHMFIVTCCFGKMRPPHEFSRYADSDTCGVNSTTSRLAKLVINSERGNGSPNLRIIEVDESSFSSKNQILHFTN
jgi:hypothetical protein